MYSVASSGALTISSQGLALGHLLQEEGLLLLDARREALGLGHLDGQLDHLALLDRLLLGLLLLGAGLPPLVSPQVAAELNVRASAVVKVESVGCPYTLASVHIKFGSVVVRLDRREGWGRSRSR